MSLAGGPVFLYVNAMPRLHPIDRYLGSPAGRALFGGKKAALARAAGLSRSYLSRMTSGSARCGAGGAHKLERATDGGLRAQELTAWGRAA